MKKCGQPEWLDAESNKKHSTYDQKWTAGSANKYNHKKWNANHSTKKKKKKKKTTKKCRKKCFQYELNGRFVAFD